MDSIGIREIAAELQPQVAALYELDTNETLDKQLHAIWRTPKNYRLSKQFASYASRTDILNYYSKQSYTWSKNGYILEITFNLENYGTKEKYTEDGRLKYYINVEPVSQNEV